MTTGWVNVLGKPARRAGLSDTVAYLGFQRGPNFRWPLVITQWGPNQLVKKTISLLSYGEKKLLVGARDANGPMPPPLANHCKRTVQTVQLQLLAYCAKRFHFCP